MVAHCQAKGPARAISETLPIGGHIGKYLACQEILLLIVIHPQRHAKQIDKIRAAFSDSET
jgi:hypothetical protein